MSDSESLIDFVSSVSGDAFLKVEETLGDGFVRLRVAEAERRQAKHDIRAVEDIVVELLRNSRDAHAQRIFVANSREGSTRTITVIDDGVGVPDGLHEKIFEPRVTSKLETMVMDRWGVHGRGMALYSVRANVTAAHVASSGLHKGMALTVTCDADRLAERADQSSWPLVERDDGGRLHVVKGPHNIIRRVLEFACEHPEMEVFLGSPSEVLATLHCQGRDRIDASDLLFCDDLTRLPVWQRPGGCSDAAELTGTAAELGLPVSERTAHRVLAGEVAPLDTVVHNALVEDEPAPAPGPDIYRDRRGLRLHHSDMDAFRRDLEEAFERLAERYYLNLRGEPRISVGRDVIRVRFDVEKED